MTTFQTIAVLAAVLGLGAPAWVCALAVYRASKRPRKAESSARFFAYGRVLTLMHDQIVLGRTGSGKTDFTIEHGALFAATIRELREYGEYRDLTLLYLEEINVTGSKKFDHVMRNELKSVERHLLEQGQ